MPLRITLPCPRTGHDCVPDQFVYLHVGREETGYGERKVAEELG